MLELIEYDGIDYKKIVFDIDVPHFIANILRHYKEKVKNKIINELNDFLTYLKTRY